MATPLYFLAKYSFSFDFQIFDVGVTVSIVASAGKEVVPEGFFAFEDDDVIVPIIMNCTKKLKQEGPIVHHYIEIGRYRYRYANTVVS